MVASGKRKNGELKASTKARELLAYMFQITTSEKVFPKRARWCTSEPMQKMAWRIFEDISLANGVLVQSESDAEERIKYQRDAIKCLITLSEQADVLYEIYNIPTERLVALTTHIDNTISAVRAWMYGDIKSYRDKFPASQSPYIKNN